jgi:hypothetical protein
MASLYARIFNLDKCLPTPTDSTESLKKLTKKVLIRKEFYHTQQLEPNLLHAAAQNTQSARQAVRGGEEEGPQLSARVLRKRFLVEDPQV